MFKDFTSFLNTQRSDSPQPESWDPRQFSCFIIDSLGHGEVVRFRLGADPCLYDSGQMFTVAYGYNENEPDCVENRILNSKRWEKFGGALDAIQDIFPNFPTGITSFRDTVTRITIETIGGKTTATVTEDLDAIISYLPIPSSLSHIPTVPITDLKHICLLDVDVDRVKWRGKTYAFKRIFQYFQRHTQRELAIIDRLANSPCIINLVAIVVNNDNTIRGFLTPFISSVDLKSVFMAARQTLGLGDDDDATAFEWPVKLSWARQITQGVVELHAIGAYNGDLKPRNALIDSTGKALLIDFHSTGVTDAFAAPEVLEMYNIQRIPIEDVLSAPADVYSLGLVLWTVAEERWEGTRTPVWREGKTPNWYRDIVNRCLVLSPEARPSASEVLSLLEREGA
ncbi:hypothetical protein M413DRAFT_443723 [Hebeloma cylindrosporum]|uniref:Protein kinase domain-containing protein n=1 Tax=Hebeloma cylindrosporum TaxID=76867 RepID=A0A0C2Y1W5_HEBCY|nr:hypothetical protein M413DRAFT_443723 [Hebeloma cylindrosporum h7]